MIPPANSVYIVQGEMNLVVAAMRRGARWTLHNHLDDDSDPLMKNFVDLKEILNQIHDLTDLESNTYLGPFLDVIRSEDTSGPVTGFALASVNKFLSYGLIDPSSPSASPAVENITDAVTHARFVGTDPSSDEVVLMKILQVLRTLVLTPVGVLLTNESICEIMQSCFRICFEMRLSELLRKSAEHALVDMVQLLFARLPQFTEDSKWQSSFKKLKMRASTMETSRGKQRKRSPRPKHKKIGPSSGSNKPDTLSLSASSSHLMALSPDSGMSSPQNGTSNCVTPGEKKIDVEGEGEECAEKNTSAAENESCPQTPSESLVLGCHPAEERLITSSTLSTPCEDYIDVHRSFQTAEKGIKNAEPEFDLCGIQPNDCSDVCDTPDEKKGASLFCPNSGSLENLEAGDSPLFKTDSEFVNSQGVRFTQQQQTKEGITGIYTPYGLPCVRELFRFLISLINSLDKHNTDIMIHIGLSLLTVALETGAEAINNFSSLLTLVKDDLSRNLFSLIASERITVFAAMLRVSFLLFESLRAHLKFQLEMYLNKLIDIIASESSRVSYEQREMVLDALAQLWRIPGLVTELYLNYDCDLYCCNQFEELTKLLSKNAFPVAGLYSTHLLALDALLTVIDSIETHCHSRILNEHQEKNSSAVTDNKKSDQEEKLTENLVYNAASGYMMGQHVLFGEKNVGLAVHVNKGKVSDKIPNHEEIMTIKHKKKLLATGTEHFNVKPSKGIQFLQDNNILSASLDPQEVVNLLKENPRLDKKMIGEFISNRKNLKVLEAFVKSFNFDETRIDEALRMYLEAFRLPGEAPLISLLMEHFAEHWHKSNGAPFANSDAAFTLAYAVIMLNVDQHNNNVKKQNNPMTVEEFKKNLSKVNGGQDFDQDMIEDIYNAIRNEEIVMPAEHTGLVRENYLWKVLLRRGMTKEGDFIHAPNGIFDHDLFSLTWGPTVAALSFVFDKSTDDTIVHRAISGFRKCAMISAHYGMSDVFDNLVISLCKFTTLLNSPESPEILAISFGSNVKAQLAAKTVFNLAHRHGDILREGWKNLIDCMLQLFRAKLLPKELVEAEDFVDCNGRISLIREEMPLQRVDSGLFSSFYSYITLTSESQNQKGPTPDDIAAQEAAQSCIQDCLPDQLVTESKFLQMHSLQELVKTLIFASHAPDGHISLGGSYDEDAAVFFLELLIKIVLQNRDRANEIWPGVRDHVYSLVMGASATEYNFLLERAVVGILRLAIRLLRREDMTAQVLQSLRMLLLLKPQTLYRVSRQISYALFELLKTNGANIHAAQDWSTLFTLLECAGAGARPPRILNGSVDESNERISDHGAQSDSEVTLHHDTQGSTNSLDRGYTSDSELFHANQKSPPVNVQLMPNAQAPASGWILVGKEGEIETVQVRPLPVNQYNIIFQCELLTHDTCAFIKACESLAFLVRDVAHITPENFETCVHCLRTFVEATLNGGKSAEKRNLKQRDVKDRKMAKMSRRKEETSRHNRRSVNASLSYQADDEDDSDECPGTYHQMSIQLLDLMHTLHTRAASIFASWSENEAEKDEGIQDATNDSIWSKCWCPLLQGIARLCCDMRRNVRTSAVTYLQRALLVHDLQMLSSLEWEACFNKVLFPLLAKLLEPISPNDPVGVEETRMRAATLLCKVFLQHLTPLLSLPTFTALWLTILDFMDKYMHAEKSDLLYEAIPESLKNMLLVMDTAGIFLSPEGFSSLWNITWDRIDVFLPALREEVFKSHQQTSTVDSTKSISEPSVNELGEVVTEHAYSEPVNEEVTTPVKKEDSVAITITDIPEEKPHVPRVAHSPLTSDDIANKSSVILQPPLPCAAVASSISQSTFPTAIMVPVSSSASVSHTSNVPLLLNPSIMEDAGISLANSQICVSDVTTPPSVSQY